MKAIVRHQYGPSDVLELADLPKPIPADDEVLIRVRAAGLNPFDWHIMRGTPWFLRLFTGIRKPKSVRLGADVAGTIVGLGKGVTEFQLGDEVFGTADGALGEYVCGSVSALVGKPANLGSEECAAVPIAALTALQALRDKGRIKPGDHVLINGAAGGVGTFAVQIARWQGAHVTGVCSTRNVELVQGIGADRVIDYSREDFARSDDRHDIVFDLVGNRSLADFRKALKADGVFIGCGGGGPETRASALLTGMLKQMIAGWFARQKIVGVLAKRSKADMEILRELLRNGVIKPVLDRTYSLAEVPEAIRYLEGGHARGKVVIGI
jgi:NADPH:quinone reductase-like Zn-dependent oxidoreductase